MYGFERWRGPLLSAQDREGVVHVIREYVAGLLPSDISKLPQTSQEALREADPADAAVVLRRDELKFTGDEEIAKLMHELVQTFAAAAARITHFDARKSAINPDAGSAG